MEPIDLLAQLPDPPTIEKMIELIGAPRSLPEQYVLWRMAADARDYHAAADPAGPFAYAAYCAALRSYHTIIIYRVRGDWPPLPGIFDNRTTRSA